MLKAGIDIGTNTILLLVAEVEGGKVKKVLEDHVRVVRLGQGVDKNRVFHPEAMDRARACFRDYAEALKKYPGIRVHAVATSGSRDAKNSAEFFREIEESFGIPIRVISGEEEARMSFVGALPGDVRTPSSLAVVDIGGGSTEIVGPDGKGGLFRFSFDMGCVRLTERFLPGDPPLDSQIQELRAFVKTELRKQKGIMEQVKGRRLIGVAGTATYLASSAMGLNAFDVEKVQGYELSLEAIQELVKKFSAMTAAERLGLGGMDKGRADVIVAGAVILEEVLLASGLRSLTTSVRGLRYGAVLSNT